MMDGFLAPAGATLLLGAVIPGWCIQVGTPTWMDQTRNLEIPGSMLRIAPE
jgi:hypothetical protein